MRYWSLILAITVLSSCTGERRVTTAPPERSGDLALLREALADGTSNLDALAERFRIEKTHHHDYGGDFSRVGGDAAPVMYFFFSDAGKIYRIHPDRMHSERGLVELDDPPEWLPLGRWQWQ